MNIEQPEKKIKIERLETHDRFLEFNEQRDYLSKGVTDCISGVPDELTCPFYIYGTSKMVEYDEKLAYLNDRYILKEMKKNVPAMRMLWVPVITKPFPTPNSWLFLCRKGSDIHQIIWILPRHEYWESCAPGQMLYNEMTWGYIQDLLYNTEKLTKKDEGGPTTRDEEMFRRVYGKEAHKVQKKKQMQRIIDNGML